MKKLLNKSIAMLLVASVFAGMTTTSFAAETETTTVEETTVVETTVEETTVEVSSEEASEETTVDVTEESTEETTETTTVEETETTTVAVDKTAGISKDVQVTINAKSVVVGEKTIDVDVAPYVQVSSQSTLVPLRVVALAILGGDVEKADAATDVVAWDANTKTATIISGDTKVEFTAKSNNMVVNGETTAMANGVVAEVTNSRIYVPFRALGEALGVDVDWVANTKTAIYLAKAEETTEATTVATTEETTVEDTTIEESTVEDTTVEESTVEDTTEEVSVETTTVAE